MLIQNTWDNFNINSIFSPLVMFILEVSLASELSETGHLGLQNAALFSVTMPSVFFCLLIAVQSNQTQSN